MLVCDNCHTRELTVVGRGVEPDATVVAVDGTPCAHGRHTIRFPSTLPGSTCKRTLTVQNACCAPLPFKWVVSARSPAPQETSVPVSVLPEEGVMEPHEEVLFDVMLSPTACGPILSVATLEMGPRVITGECSGSPEALRRLQLQCEGIAPCHPAAVYPRTLRAPEVLEVGSTFAQSFFIRNPAAVEAEFTIRGAEEGPVAVSEQHGTVAAQSVRVIHVVASAAAKFELQHMLQCRIEHGLEQNVNVEATFALQLPVQLLTPGIDFGLVCRGTAASAAMQLKNPSSHNSAAWSVSTEPAVHGAAALEAPVGSGVLQAQECGVVQLQCTGVAAGVWCASVRVSSCGVDALVPVRAVVVAPRVTLGAATEGLDLGATYVAVPVTRSLELVNGADVPARWQLRPGLLGPGAGILQVLGQPDGGTLAAGAREVVSVTVTPHDTGSVDSVLVVDVEHAETPVVVPVSCCAEGLRVDYSLARSMKAPDMDTTGGGGEAEPLEGGVIDFGQQIAVGDVVTVRLVLTNPTAIEAPVELELEHFKAAAEDGEELPSGGKLPGGGRRLLLGDDHEKTAPFRAQAGRELFATRAAQA